MPNKSNIKINPIEQQQTTSKEPIVSKKEKIVLNEAKPNPKNLNTTGKLKLKPIITTPNNEERIGIITFYIVKTFIYNYFLQ